jgi:hypothetical protein
MAIEWYLNGICFYNLMMWQNNIKLISSWQWRFILRIEKVCTPHRADNNPSKMHLPHAQWNAQKDISLQKLMRCCPHIPPKKSFLNPPISDFYRKNIPLFPVRNLDPRPTKAHSEPFQSPTRAANRSRKWKNLEGFATLVGLWGVFGRSLVVLWW